MVGVFVAKMKDGAVRVAVTGAGPGVFRVPEMEAALAKDFSVKASMGHVRDLPEKGLAVDVDRFTPARRSPDDGPGRPAYDPDMMLALLLYAYGTTNSAHRSGGEANLHGGAQTIGGMPLGLHRSGGFESEIYGNYNTLGWLFLPNDNDWLATGNFGNFGHFVRVSASRSTCASRPTATR